MKRRPKMNSELQKKLETIAYNRTSPFCYSCYAIAKSGTCLRCGTDDLMLHMDGVGVEYGTDWVIKEIIESECEAVDIDQAFEDSMDGIYPETTTIGFISYDTLSAIKELDPIAWEVAKSEWVEQEVENEWLVTLDGGTTYFHQSDLENLK